jgi:hypothetical protein
MKALGINAFPANAKWGDEMTRGFGANNPTDAFKFAMPTKAGQIASEYELLGGYQDVLGDPCLALERKDKDIILLDNKHGYVCRKRNTIRHREYC